MEKRITIHMDDDTTIVSDVNVFGRWGANTLGEITNNNKIIIVSRSPSGIWAEFDIRREASVDMSGIMVSYDVIVFLDLIFSAKFEKILQEIKIEVPNITRDVLISQALKSYIELYYL